MAHIIFLGGVALDKIIYTEKATKEEICEELNDLLSKFIRELNEENK